MLPFFDIFLNVCLPLLTAILIGWTMDRLFSLHLRTLVKINIYLFVPVFILVRLSTSPLDSKVGILVILFTFCMIAAMALISWGVSRWRGDSYSQRASLQLSTMIYNSGNWGIPLMALSFPGLGPVIQVFVLATMNVSTFSLGVILANQGGSNTFKWKPILQQPSLYAIIVALLIRWLGNPLDDIEFIWRPLNYFADGLIGIALFTLGVQLSQTKPPRLHPRLAWSLIIRLLLGPAVAVLLTLLFGFSPTISAILILGAASPAAVNTALLAHEFGADSRFASAAVFYSTILAAIVVTVLLAILQAGIIPWAAI